MRESSGRVTRECAAEMPPSTSALPRSFTLCVFLVTLHYMSSRSYAEDAAVTQERVPVLLDKGMFIIESRHLNMCIAFDSLGLSLKDCKLLSENMLWKWGSEGLLYNIGNRRCLALSLIDPNKNLVMLECDSKQRTLTWQCKNGMLIGANYYTVAAENGKVVARKQRKHKWRPYMSHDENLCEHYYQEVYTLQGNGFGKPCALPFKFKNKWFHECIKEGRTDNAYWCSTTMLYDRDEQWGFCPSSERECKVFWEQNNDTQTCYQFNLDSLLPWNKARASCQAQGGDLLSISDVAEGQFISGHIKKSNFMGDFYWIGLNQLNGAAGWQWSDGSPLSLVNWKSSFSHSNSEEIQCGVSNAKDNQTWQSYGCHWELPYVCKMYIAPRTNTTFENWKYYDTRCDLDWYPYNNHCYNLSREEQTWEAAADACHTTGSELMSVTSLADVELVLNLLESQNVSEAWIGLNLKTSNPLVFQWSDGSSVSFTDWYRHEPSISQVHGGLCVSAQSNDGRWKVKNCLEKKFSICKKEGNIETESSAEYECQKGWERHGAYCYKIDDTLRTYEHASSGYFCASPLATISNRFEQAFIASMISSNIQTEETYYWIALQDQNNTGEYAWIANSTYQLPVTYTNWNKYQPSRHGGCVTIRNGNSFGRWEVKDCNLFKAMSLCKKTLTALRTGVLNPEEKQWNSELCHTWEFEPHFHHCYKVFHHEKVLRKRTWEEAEYFCQGYGGHLLSFSHIDEENFIRDLLNTMFHDNEQRQFWIGFNKRNPSSGGSWEWSDRSPVVSSFLDDMYVSDETRNCATFKVDKTIVPLNCDTNHEWICKILKGNTLRLPDWHVKEIPWVFFHGNDYFFYDLNADWDGFRFVCGWMGSQIVAIHSPVEQAFIQRRIQKFSKKNKNWWIGLKYENERDGFQRWRDLNPVVYSNWANEQTNIEKLNEMQCAYISSETGKWGYTTCSENLPSICKTNTISKIEKESYKHPLENDKPENGSCPAGWLYYGYKCFSVYTIQDEDISSDWFSANSHCSAHGGTLAWIENEMEQAFIVMQLFKKERGVWINFKRQEYEDWLNGTSNTYSNWSPFAVYQHEDHDLCPLISVNHNIHLTGKWYLENCTEKNYGFVCEKAQELSTNVANKYDMYPVSEILHYGDKIYRIISGNMTWFDASSKCQEYGEELVSITDQYHQSFLTVIVNRLGFPHWIGYFKLEDAVHFEWADESRSLYTAWENEVLLSDGNCAYMDIDGYWRIKDCNTELPGAACLLSNKNNNDFPYNGDKCLKTWRRFKDYCYSISSVLNKTDFHTAQEICKKQGSSLLTILNEEEEAFIIEELEPFTTVQMIWLNSIVYHNRSAVWLDGTVVRYSNWITENPENELLIGDPCVNLRLSDGSWLLTDCNVTRGFVCRTHKDYKKDENKSDTTTRTNHAVIPIAIIVALTLLVFCLVAWYMLRQNKRLSCTRPPLLKLLFTQSNSQAADAEDSILFTEMDTSSEKELCK